MLPLGADAAGEGPSSKKPQVWLLLNMHFHHCQPDQCPLHIACIRLELVQPIASPSRTGGTSTTGTLGPREHGSGARPPHKAAPADGSPRSPQRAPPMAAGSAPSIEEGHDTCVAHTQGSEAFALSARPQILFLLCQDEKGEGRCRGFLVPTVATGSHPRCGSPDWPAASVALAKLLAMHIVRPHPQLTKSEILGKG